MDGGEEVTATRLEGDAAHRHHNLAYSGPPLILRYHVLNAQYHVEGCPHTDSDAETQPPSPSVKSPKFSKYTSPGGTTVFIEVGL